MNRQNKPSIVIKNFDKAIRSVNNNDPGDFHFLVNGIKTFVQAVDIFDAWSKICEVFINTEIEFQGKARWDDNDERFARSTSRFRRHGQISRNNR